MPDINYSSLSGGQQSSYPAGTTAQRPSSPTSGQIFYDTDIASLIIWNGAAWGMLNSAPVPAAPVIGTATDVGTNRSWNDGQVTITFTPGGAFGTVADTYRATSSPSGITSPSSATSPLTVSGLTTNQSYTFTVTGTNEIGTSSASSATNSVTVTTVPDTPTINSVADSGTSGTVTINFSSPNNGGKAITNYKYSTDGTNYTAFSPAQTTSPLTITGLTNFQAYTFRIKAVNANGDSVASNLSSSVTPTSQFTLAQTFNTSGTYTVPNTGVGELALYVIGAGTGGASNGGIGANTSGASAGFALVNGGQSYSVTIGAANQGVSSFGSFLNSQGNGNANGKVNGNGGGNGGSHGNSNNQGGTPGNAGGNLAISASGLPNAIQYGGGGGGGGHHWNARGGGGGGAPYGGGGGSGEGYEYDGWNRENYYANASPGGPGQAGGGGGGGRGRGGSASDGSGGPGKVIIYTRPR